MNGGEDNQILNVQTDIDLFKIYCLDNGYTYDILGTFLQTSEKPCISFNKCSKLIGDAFTRALSEGRYLLLYFTGHGWENTGDWDLNGAENMDMISINKILIDIISKFKEIKKNCGIFIVSDCCNSGRWVEIFFKNKSNFPHFCEILSSCGPKKNGHNIFFSLALWSDDVSRQHVLGSDLFDLFWDKIASEMEPHYHNREDNEVRLLKDAKGREFTEWSWYANVSHNCFFLFWTSAITINLYNYSRLGSTLPHFV